jgi:hypothetical protein
MAQHDLPEILEITFQLAYYAHMTNTDNIPLYERDFYYKKLIETKEAEKKANDDAVNRAKTTR